MNKLLNDSNKQCFLQVGFFEVFVSNVFLKKMLVTVTNLVDAFVN